MKKASGETGLAGRVVDSAYGLSIGGRWASGGERKTFNSRNRANGELPCTCADACGEYADLAAPAAWKALENWKDMLGFEVVEREYGRFGKRFQAHPRGPGVSKSNNIAGGRKNV